MTCADRNSANPTAGALSLDLLNQLLVPVRLAIPQPVVARLPLLRTNEDERFRQVLNHFRGTVLDIGCGRNRLLALYRKRGGDGIGVDVWDWGGGPDLVVSDTAQLPFEAGIFDSVSFVACLNHIPNRLEVLREAHRVLKPGGRLIATNLTPRVSAVWHRLAFWDADQHERGMEQGEVWGFAHEELVCMVSGRGFRLRLHRSFMWRMNRVYVFEKERHGGVGVAD